ncbi:MAG: shikimate kinase, partial [Acidobacteriaceae bacterium]
MTWHNRNLYLVGLPGAGKSAIGQALAELLGDHEFVDLDCTIERDASATIANIVATKGEHAFRELETQALLSIAGTSGKPKIIATGGGIVMSPLNRSIMRGSGIPIWIDVTIRDAANNVLNDSLRGHARPLLQAASIEDLREQLTNLLEVRRPFYEQAILHFVLRNPRASERSVDELAREVVIALDKMSHSVVLAPRHRTLVAKSGFGNYPIFVGSGIAARELHFVAKDRDFRQICVLLDRQIEHLHWHDFKAKIAKSLGPKVSVEEIVIEGGERDKNVSTAMEILTRLNALSADRRSTLLVSFGGGVITDMAGFAASLYSRRLPLLHIPTTLIAQADAAIGGKTGVNHFGRKNSIGTFNPPEEVIVDPLYLKTLPKRERLAGLAEVFKYA